VLQWAGFTYWAFSYQDNRVAMKIVAFDASRTPVAQWDMAGARYPWQITVDNVAQSVTFHGQANARITMAWNDLSIWAPFHRSLASANTDHFYTISRQESEQANKDGWADEGICCRILGTPSPRSVPLLRFFNSKTVDHFYTTDPSREKLAGYSFEQIAGYVYPYEMSGTKPLFRLYLEVPGTPMVQDHFYTIDSTERDEAISKHKYVDEGIAGWVMPAQ
jgi:hypothetical protein